MSEKDPFDSTPDELSASYTRLYSGEVDEGDFYCRVAPLGSKPGSLVYVELREGEEIKGLFNLFGGRDMRYESPADFQLPGQEAKLVAIMRTHPERGDRVLATLVPFSTSHVGAIGEMGCMPVYAASFKSSAEVLLQGESMLRNTVLYSGFVRVAEDGTLLLRGGSTTCSVSFGHEGVWDRACPIKPARALQAIGLEVVDGVNPVDLFKQAILAAVNRLLAEPVKQYMNANL